MVTRAELYPTPKNEINKIIDFTITRESIKKKKVIIIINNLFYNFSARNGFLLK